MGSKGNRQLVPQAKKQLNQMKYEIANELNIPSHATQTGYWGDLTCKQCGSVGGEMVKRMIAAAGKHIGKRCNDELRFFVQRNSLKFQSLKADHQGIRPLS